MTERDRLRSRAPGRGRWWLLAWPPTLLPEKAPYWNGYWNRHLPRCPSRAFHIATARGAAGPQAAANCLRHQQPVGHAKQRGTARLTSTEPSVITGTAAMAHPRSRRPGTASSLRALLWPRPASGSSNGCPERLREPRPRPPCWVRFHEAPPLCMAQSWLPLSGRPRALLRRLAVGVLPAPGLRRDFEGTMREHEGT